MSTMVLPAALPNLMATTDPNSDIHQYMSTRGFNPLRPTQPTTNHYRCFQVKQTAKSHSGCPSLNSVCTKLSSGSTPAWYQPPAVLPFNFRLTHTFAHRSLRTGRVTYNTPRPGSGRSGPRTFVAEHSRIKQPSRRGEYTELLAKHLRVFNVREDDQTTIIGRIFEVVGQAVPSKIIDVLIEDVTISELDDRLPDVPRRDTTTLRGNVPMNAAVSVALNLHRRVTTTTAMESRPMEWYRAKPIPASKSSIDGLEKVTIDESCRSKLEFEECAVCMERFVEEQEECEPASKKRRNDVDVDHDHRDLPEITITRLPCSHHYHTECIVQWLELNHRCPLCRFKMPTAEAAGVS